MGEFRVNTSKLQKLVSKVVKGAGNDRFLPITSLMSIEISNGILSLSTTDGNNILTVCDDVNTDIDNLSITVPVMTFSKLISKFTCTDTILDLQDAILIVKGNGTYKISLLVDENGIVEFPKFSYKEIVSKYTISKSIIMNMYNFNKSAVNIDTSDCLSGYYVSDNVVTTNENIICIYTKKVFDTPVLLPANLVKLLPLLDDVEINVSFYPNNAVSFISDNVRVDGYIRSDIEYYPIDGIIVYKDKKFNYRCEVSKIELQRVLNRISLFVEPYDRNAIKLSFNSDCLEVCSKNASAIDIIKYHIGEHGEGIQDLLESMIYFINFDLFKSQVDAMPLDRFYIYFGESNAIKLACDDVMSIIALYNVEENLK